MPGPAQIAAAFSPAIPRADIAEAHASTVSATQHAAATHGFAIHPVPEMLPIKGTPFFTPRVRTPSVMMSSAPLMTTVTPHSRARLRAASFASPSIPAESTPRTFAATPARTPISPAFPFTTVIGSSSINLSAVCVRYGVAPAPTGSRIIGMFLFAAVSPAASIPSIWFSSSVPIFRTSALAILSRSMTSFGACDITGAAPKQIVMLAQSFTVT